MIRLIQDDETEVYRNLAMEHAMVELAKDTSQITIRCWRNKPSVILGRSQIIESEINRSYCDKNDIKIARRISGGGAVYHDLGNLNTSFLLPIQPTKAGYSDVIDIGRHLTKIQADMLWILGFSNISIHNDTNILCDSKKISGSAGYLFKGWYVHHSTLLLNVNLDHLENSLLVKEMEPSDKKSSKYYPTINLKPIDEQIWLQKLALYIGFEFKQEFEFGDYTSSELILCKELENKLYCNLDWITKGKRNY